MILLGSTYLYHPNVGLTITPCRFSRVSILKIKMNTRAHSSQTPPPLFHTSYRSELPAVVSDSLSEAAKFPCLLPLHVLPTIQPIQQRDTSYILMRTSTGRFHSSLLGAFDIADAKRRTMDARCRRVWQLGSRGWAQWRLANVLSINGETRKFLSTRKIVGFWIALRRRTWVFMALRSFYSRTEEQLDFLTTENERRFYFSDQ